MQRVKDNSFRDFYTCSQNLAPRFVPTEFMAVNYNPGKKSPSLYIFDIKSHKAEELVPLEK